MPPLAVQNLVFDLQRMLGCLPVTGGALRSWIHWASQRTGLPGLVIAATLVVISWRIVLRSLRLVAEVTIAVVLLLVATRLGWIVW